MNTYLVKLHDGTVGEVKSSNAPLRGYEITITIHDDNGNPVPVTGVVVDVLEAVTSKR